MCFFSSIWSQFSLVKVESAWVCLKAGYPRNPNALKPRFPHSIYMAIHIGEPNVRPTHIQTGDAKYLLSPTKASCLNDPQWAAKPTISSRRLARARVAPDFMASRFGLTGLYHWHYVIFPRSVMSKSDLLRGTMGTMQLMVKVVLSSRLKISKIYRDHDGCFGDPNSVHLGSTTVQPMPLESGFDLLSITSGHYKFSCFPIKTAANASNSHPPDARYQSWLGSWPQHILDMEHIVCLIFSTTTIWLWNS